MNEFKNWLPWNLADISVKFLLVFCQFPPSFWTVHEGNRWVSKDHRNHGFCGQTPCFSQIWDSTSWFFKEAREFHMFVGSYPHPMLAAYHHVVLSKLGDTSTPCMAIWMGKRELRVPSAFPNKLISYFWLHTPFHPWNPHDFSFGCRLFLLFQTGPRLKAHTRKLTSTIAATNYV